MRYRPFGQAGMPVSAIAFTVDDRAGQRGAKALGRLIFAAMEAGVNAFHIESCEPEVLNAVGRALAAVERQLLFVSLRLGLRPGRTGLTRDFSPGALTGAIDRALNLTGLGRLDLVLLDAPGEDELPVTALTALKQQRARGRVGLLGVAGGHDAIDTYLRGRAFDVLASPHHPRSGSKELNRMKAAARMDMGVIAYDYFPELFRQLSTTPGVPKKRSLLDALAGAPELHPLAGAGTFAFLHEMKSWTPEELCLAYALSETSVSTVLIRADELERLEALVAVPDRDLPPGMAAKVEMARFALEQAADTSGAGGILEALKSLISYIEGSFADAPAAVAPSPKVVDVPNEISAVEAPPPRAKVRSKRLSRSRSGERAVERLSRRINAPSPENASPLSPMPDVSPGSKTVTPPATSSRAERNEAPALPLSRGAPRPDTTPPPKTPTLPEISSRAKSDETSALPPPRGLPHSNASLRAKTVAPADAPSRAGSDEAAALLLSRGVPRPHASLRAKTVAPPDGSSRAGSDEASAPPPSRGLPSSIASLRAKTATPAKASSRVESDEASVVPVSRGLPSSIASQRAKAATPAKASSRAGSDEASVVPVSRGLPSSIAALRAKTVTAPDVSSRAVSDETPALPPLDATPHLPPPAAQPGAAQPQTAIWRSKDYDYPVELTGESFPGPDGRTYLKVNFDGEQTFVPADEMIFFEDLTEPEPVDGQAVQARTATGAR